MGHVGVEAAVHLRHHHGQAERRGVPLDRGAPQPDRVVVAEPVQQVEQRRRTLGPAARPPRSGPWSAAAGARSSRCPARARRRRSRTGSVPSRIPCHGRGRNDTAATALTMPSYPVHRHRLPDSAIRMSSSVGAGCVPATRSPRPACPGCRTRTARRPGPGTPAAARTGSSPVCDEPLDGGDLRAVGLHREVGAGVHRTAVEQHHAGAALGVVAALLGPGQADLLAHRVQQGGVPASTWSG